MLFICRVATLTKEPGIEEEESGQDPTIGVSSEGRFIVDEGQQTPHEEECASDHTAKPRCRLALETPV